MSSEPELNDRQRRFVAEVARGLSPQEAARSVGYRPAYVRKASRLLKQPIIAKAVAAIRAEARTVAAYGLVEAMKEADDAATFAKAKGNAMANVKACELRAKLSGLLIDRVEIATVDLTSALAKAEARVSTPPCAGGLGTLSPLLARAGIDWNPRIPGGQSTEEAGPGIKSESCS